MPLLGLVLRPHHLPPCRRQGRGPTGLPAAGPGTAAPRSQSLQGAQAAEVRQGVERPSGRHTPGTMHAAAAGGRMAALWSCSLLTLPRPTVPGCTCCCCCRAHAHSDCSAGPPSCDCRCRCCCWGCCNCPAPAAIDGAGSCFPPAPTAPPPPASAAMPARKAQSGCRLPLPCGPPWAPPLCCEAQPACCTAPAGAAVIAPSASSSCWISSGLDTSILARLRSSSPLGSAAAPAGAGPAAQAALPDAAPVPCHPANRSAELSSGLNISLGLHRLHGPGH